MINIESCKGWLINIDKVPIIPLFYVASGLVFIFVPIPI
jgi:hypothetical protein